MNHTLGEFKKCVKCEKDRLAKLIDKEGVCKVCANGGLVSFINDGRIKI